MVNASLNWASIVGIVLAVCGGGLYFLRSFKPALARDYDVFFAAIGLLCGGILFFQGWRLDPILQFGQFLLAGTAIFWGYESVRLRGVATDQARRSSYFDEEPISDVPRNSRGRFNDDFDRFEESERPTRRFKPQEDEFEDEFMEGRSSRRNVSRAIAASAVSRRRPSSREVNKFQNGVSNERRRQTFDDRNSNESGRNKFGERRVSSNEIKIGSRPKRNQTSSRQENISTSGDSSLNRNQSKRSSIRQQASKQEVEDASFQDANPIKKSRETRRVRTSGRSTIKDQNSSGRYTVGTNRKKPRDNSSRFDD